MKDQLKTFPAGHPGQRRNTRPTGHAGNQHLTSEEDQGRSRLIPCDHSTAAPTPTTHTGTGLTKITTSKYILKEGQRYQRSVVRDSKLATSYIRHTFFFRLCDLKKTLFVPSCGYLYSHLYSTVGSSQSPVQYRWDLVTSQFPGGVRSLY